ncbi:MAG: HD domain-containing protein [Bacteroidetes bacterium]|nr:HD domain-containing protein [Bacteroidota bacterium]MCW5896650.1 HD domain-containing protein [Bacteroidota bacterium]
MNNEILAQAEAYVSTLCQQKLPAWAVYHNLLHTQQIVRAAEELAEGCKLSKSDTETVLLSAWFHDAGYVDAIEGHEGKSVEIATKFLDEKNYPAEKIEIVANCIRATKIPQSPKTLLEEIVCDADMSHLGKKRFFERSDLLRMEMELRTGTMFTDLEWIQRNVDFASAGRFFTQYARREWEGRRQKNLVTLQEMFRSLQAQAVETAANIREKKNRAAAKQEKEQRPERGIETMFRVVPKNHLDLTALADHKASILIGTTGTIMAIVFSVLVSKLDTHPHLVWPTIILLAVCLVTMIFSILATRPIVTTGTFTREDINQRKVNLLFFGNFHRSSLEDFDWGMREMMIDRDYLYGSMIKDLYFLGRVLGVKYRYLRIAYTVFMWGLIVSVIAYTVAMVSVPPPLPFPAQ